jgi:adenosine deaminase
VRASLEYSFLPGGSLRQRADSFRWVSACAGDRPGNDKTSPTCQKFLDNNEKARVEWKLEGELERFERRF